MIKSVRSLQTSDGKIFSPEQKEDALKHEFMLSMRGLIHTAIGGTRAGGNVSTTEMASVLVSRADEFINALRKNREALRRAGVKVSA